MQVSIYCTQYLKIKGQVHNAQHFRTLSFSLNLFFCTGELTAWRADMARLLLGVLSPVRDHILQEFKPI
jgi:hypothetical protein